MKKTLSVTALLINTLLFGTHALASETYIHYQHSYGMQNRYHGDEFGVLHQADGGGWMDITIHLYNKNQDVAIDDVVSNSYSMTAGYNYALTEALTLMPSIEARFYAGGTSGEGTEDDPGDTQKAGARYTPGLKLSWQIAAPFNIHAQYRYDYRKITRSLASDDEQNKHRHRIEGGMHYSPFDTLTLSYTAYYYDADYILADNQQHDYQQDINIDWTFLPRWQLNLGAEDVAKSKTSSGREALLKAGFTYRF